MVDLFDSDAAGKSNGYSAKDIEVLEGLEPVRRRPGMYIGGTDARALHHLAAEVLDNAMDEAVAGHASRIEIELAADDTLTVRDNGRGIPTDPHASDPSKSALEVVLTKLHAGGKFSGDAYKTSGGLHGVGVSVVNALSDRLVVEVARDRVLYRQAYSRGLPVTKLETVGPVANRRGTMVSFHPDPEIFGDGLTFNPATLYRMARSKAYLYKGVEIRWSCAEEVKRPEGIPDRDVLHFPGGLADYLASTLSEREPLTATPLRRRGRSRRGPRASNGRSPGRRTARASPASIATPSRRPTAARTSRGCAAPSPAACAPTASGPAPSAPRSSLPTT